MAPRTRATATTSVAPTNLAAAPRRRLRVTPLDKDDKKLAKPDEITKPATRATRARANTLDSQDESATVTVKPTAAKPRGRPKKSDTVAVKETVHPVEKLAEKPKRATRSTRATATTASSEAKEKPAAKVTRATKSITRTTRTKDKETAPEEKEDQPDVDLVPVSKFAAKKKVTFQEIEDDKENQPITKAVKKTASTKSTSTASGLRAKPVRKPVSSTATRASKRSKDQTSDDEQEEKPRKKIQRILTPKKITQINRPLTPDDDSEDELTGGKTPVRDLSMSPKRPQTAVAVEAIAKTLSPAKKLDFTQSLVQHSEKKISNAETHGALTSPARRPPTSPAKLFTQSTLTSTTKLFQDESNNTLASPARRPIMSPIKEGEEQTPRHIFGNASKLLFPNAHKTTQINCASSSTNLLQSPKRSASFDPARIFAHSVVKPQSTNLSKRSFFSSPAKRVGTFSPLKKTTTPDSTAKSVRSDIQSPDLDLNDIEVTNLMHDETIEFTATSYQRSSASPLRTYKLTEDEMRLDFDDSVLEIRSPLKISKSPMRAVARPEPEAVVLQTVQEDDDDDDDMTEALISAQSTPHVDYSQKSFVSLQAMDAEDGSKLKDSNPDLTMTDVNDDTIDLSEVAAEGTPCAPATYDHMNISLDELAQSPQEDVVAEFLRTPGTPAIIHEHEPSKMISSPAEGYASPTMTLDQQEPARSMSSPRQDEELAVEESSISLHEHELTNMAFTPRSTKSAVRSSPVILNEHEFTNMLSSPALIEEHEFTRMGCPSEADESIVERSPVSVHKDELTSMLSSPQPEECVEAQLPPASVLEHKITDMHSPQEEKALGDDSPVLLHEHEFTNMLSSPPAEKAMTPNLPIPRKFNLNTVVTKVPLKPEAQDSPFKLSIKKRKRPFSLGGQPDFVDIIQKPSKSPRTSVLPDVDVSHIEPVMTPASTKSVKTPASKVSTVRSGRRVTSTPNPTRTPLASVVNGVLTGAVVYVDVRTSEGADASAIYIELLSGLGAKVVSSIADASLLTHIVFKDGYPKTLEKIRRASIGDGINAKVVGVSWPLDCDANKEWVDEEAYLLNLTPTDHVIGSISRSAKRKSMEPSMLITDGSGSVKRSRSRGRVSIRRSSIKPFVDSTNDATPPRSSIGQEDDMMTPVANTAKKQADLERNSLTAAWKSINATQNLGEDTPARRTLELLQKTYALEQDDWNSTILSSTDEQDGNNAENTPRSTGAAINTYPNDYESVSKTTTTDLDKSILETGLTPAPYRTHSKTQIGSAPAKQRGIELMSYRERVEEMERREIRDNAIGVEGGKGRGVRGKGKRVTMFGGEGGSGLAGLR